MRRIISRPRTGFPLSKLAPICAASMADTNLMSIPGQVDPVPVAREITPREDGRVDLPNGASGVPVS